MWVCDIIKRVLKIAAALWLSTLPALAQDVSLTSQDRAFSVSGTLLGFDGEFYRVDTIYGPLTIDGQRVTCEGDGCPDLNTYVEEVSLSGTHLMAEVLIPALIQSFVDRQGLSVLREITDPTHSVFTISDQTRVRARFRLRATTSAEGYADLIAEEADIALVLREPRAVEVEMAQASGLGDFRKDRRARVIARDGIVAITDRNAQIQSLTMRNLTDILSGQATSWPGETSQDTPLKVHLPMPNSGVSEAFEDAILSPQGLSFLPTATRHLDLKKIAQAADADVPALGLTTLSALGSATPITIIGNCGIEQVASLDNLRSEDYPLALPLMLFTPARRLPAIAREFLGFTRTRQANIVIRRMGFLDQSIRLSDLSSQGKRLVQTITNASGENALDGLRRLASELQFRDRLSTTFRFIDQGARLDAQSYENITRLGKALELGGFDGQELLFIEFGASSEPSQRANDVMNMLRSVTPAVDLARIRMRAAAFNDVLPIACADTDWGRSLNRRVEIWVK